MGESRTSITWPNWSDLRYLLEAPDVDPDPPAGASPEARWFGWEEAIALADPGLIGALRALRPTQALT